MNHTGKVLGLAAIYAVAGWFGLQLAVPPGYATVIWPASGFAIAGLLFYGHRLWPGIALGSFVINCWVGGAFADASINWTAVVVALSIAGGSTLQALLACFAVRRLYGTPIRLGNPKDVVVVGAICGPLSCLVAPTVGVSTLFIAGFTSPDVLATNWFIWWVGDMAGVLVFLPIGLLSPWRPWTMEWAGRPVTGFTIATLLCLVVPLYATFYAWKITSEITHERNKAAFATLADDGERAFMHRIESYKQALDGGAGLFRASDNVTLDEWRTYVATLDIARTLPGINGIGFIEPVAEDRLATYPDQVKVDGIEEFAIHPADGEKFANFIIKFIEPIASNRQAVGLNIGFERNRFNAATHARDTGKATITNRIFLVQDQTKSAGFLLLRPLYAGGTVPESVSERQQAFLGWVYAPFVAPRFMDGLTSSQSTSLGLSVYDGDRADPEQLIYSNVDADAGAQPVYRIEHVRPTMEQTWTVVWQSTPAFEASVSTKEPFLVLGGGLAISGLFGALLLSFARREDAIRTMVQRKTRELAAQVHQNRSIVDTAVVGIMLLDGKENILSANQAVERMFGYSAEALIGRPLTDLMPAGRERMRQRMNTGDDTDVSRDPIVATRRTGGELFLDVQINSWTSEEGEDRYTTIIRNVSEETRAKIALETTEQRWKLALEGADIGVFDVDLARETSVVSPAWMSMLGFDEDEDIEPQAEWRSRIHQSDLPTVRQADAACIAGETARSVSEYRLRHKSGRWIWLRSDAVVVDRDTAGAPIRMIGTQTDITELKRAEVALRASEERFRTAIQSAPVGMALVSLERKWLMVNGALCNLLGYTDDELRATSPFSHIHSDDVPNDTMANDLLGGRIQTYQRELRFRHKNGSTIWVLTSVSLAHDADDDSRYFVVQFQDITDQKEMERLKTEFVATVSHELRTPLTSIRGSLGLVLGTMKANLPDKASRLLTIAHSNCERLVLLINDILDLEKISSGQMRFESRRESLSELVRQASDANQGYADQHGITQEVDIEEGIWIVDVDQARIHQVLANLLSNASKFSPQGSAVRISTAVSGDRIRVSVSDNGPGIPPEFRSKIFGRFSQADGSATRSQNGTGLGLHISRQIIEKQGGSIGFDSVHGEGSTFWFELPIVESVSTSTPSTGGDLPLILHVEDDHDFYDVVTAYLDGKANTINATTVASARKRLGTADFDLVILDVGLFDGNGLELLDDLARHDLPVMILSAQENLSVGDNVDARLSKSRATEAEVVETVLDILHERAERSGSRGRVDVDARKAG